LLLLLDLDLISISDPLYISFASIILDDELSNQQIVKGKKKRRYIQVF